MIRPMLAWAAIGCAALASPRASGADPRLPVDIYLVAGQSNAAGRGILANLPGGFVPDNRAWLYHSPHLKSTSPALTWAPLRAATEQAGWFGPELSLGTRLQQLARDRPVAIIKHAFSATDLAGAWNPGKDPADRAHWGMQFEAFVGTVEAGLRAMRDMGFEPTIRGMAWQQGESDADFLKPSQDYAANLARFIARVREQFRSPDMVFVYGFVLPFPNKQPFREQVRMAQGAVDQDSGSPWAVKKAFVVFTDDLSHIAHDANSPDPNDHVHIGTAGMIELGRRMAETMAGKGKLAR